MKKICFLILLAVGLHAFAQTEAKKVLFIGNSYTEVNDLPGLVRTLAENQGRRIETASNTPGGCFFRQHCTNTSMDLIRQGGWDVVVLQEQSQNPAFPWAQCQNDLFPYAERLVDSVYACNPDGEAMFYMTWGHKNGDERNAPYFDSLATYEGMDDLLYERYLYMARTYDASVCPVGRVWRRIREEIPDIELFQSDGSHPTYAGSYAAACAFYVMIFHSDPSLITYDYELDAASAAAIRRVAEEVVYDHLDFWVRQSQVGMDERTVRLQVKVCPNPSSGHIRIEADPGTCLRLSDLEGRTRPVSAEMDLPAGLYLLRASQGGRTATTKIIIL